MKTRKLAVSVSFALALVPMAALASAPHQWWVENHNTEHCVSSASVGGVFVTPYKMWTFMRDNDGHDIQVKKFTYPSPMGYSVLVSGKKPGSHHAISVTFFSSLKVCEGFVHFAVKHGYQPNIQDMK